MIHLNLYIFIIYISKKLSYNLPLLWSVLSIAVRIKQLCFFSSITAPKIPPSALKSGESNYVVSGKLWAVIVH